MSGSTSAIETAGGGAYLRRVSFARLIRFLTIFAMLLAPLAMIGTGPVQAQAHHSAMSMQGHQMAGHEMAADPAMAAMSHCQGMDKQSKDQPCRSDDCQLACAAVPAIPAIGGQLEPQVLMHGPLQPPALVAAPHGLDPEAETPPPRFA